MGKGTVAGFGDTCLTAWVWKDDSACPVLMKSPWGAAGAAANARTQGPAPPLARGCPLCAGRLDCSARPTCGPAPGRSAV